MSWALTIKDGLGTLGNTSTSKIARCVYYGLASNFSPVSIPDFQWGDGILLRFMGSSYLGEVPFEWWNASTKQLTPDGGTYTIVGLMFRGARRYISSFMGLTLLNANSEVVLDNLNRNAEIVSQGRIDIVNAHDVQTVTYPEIDAPLVFVQMPENQYIYIGNIQSTYAKFSAQTGGTRFNYFVVGFRKDISGVSPGMALTLRRNGQIIFNSQRSYPRIYGCYAYPPYQAIRAVPPDVNARTNFNVEYYGAPTGNYVSLVGGARAPYTVDSWYVWAFKRQSNVLGGGLDWITRYRFTMQNGPADQLELATGSQPSETYFTPPWTLLGGLS